LNIENEKLVKRYLSLRGNNITERTRKAFEWDLGVFLKFIKDKPLEEVTHIDVDGFIEYCTNERHNGDQALSRKYNTVNMFFNTMINKEYLDMKNPLDKVEKIKVRKKLRGHVTFEEYRQITDYLETNKDYRGLALFSLLYSSGIRVSELFQLNRNSFDFDNREFSVIGKGKKARTCIFSDEAKTYMLQYLEARHDDLESLFVSREHNRWSIGSIQNYVKGTAKKAGITKNIHVHLVRHGTAMLLLDHKMPLDEIQKILGHENIGTTQLYAQTSMERVKKDADTIYSKVFGNSEPQ
jgi:integrase/recombinase XerD